MAASSSPCRAADGAKTVQHFRRALIGVADQRLERLAGAQVGKRRCDQGMTRQYLVEGFVGADRLFAMPMPVLEPCVRIDEPQCALLAIVGGLKALRRLRHVIGEIGNQRRVVVSERAEPLVLELIDLGQGALVVAGAGIGPGSEQSRRDVALPPSAALRKAVAGCGILALLEGANAERKMGEPVLRIALKQPVGQTERVRHVAVRERGDESALDQFRITRIVAQRLTEEGGRRKRVPLGSGDQGGEIIPGWAIADLKRGRDGKIVARAGASGLVEAEAG